MKFVATSCLVATAFAGVNNMNRLIQQIRREAVVNGSAQTRSFASAWGQKLIESIDGYGCWCYFQEDHGNGRGKPINQMDQRCKQLHDAYECILMDTDNTCIPWDVEYGSATGLGIGADEPGNDAFLYAIRKGCDKNNKKDECARMACKVEGYFVVNMFMDYLDAVVFDPTLLHSLGMFNPKDECPIDGGIQIEGKECCGEYPIRFPFKTLNGDRACCFQKTYNTNLKTCCDGVVKKEC